MTSLDELIRLRNFAKDLCAPHAASVLAFQCASKISFRIDSEEKDDTDTLRLQHLTSSATCLESLLECRDPDVVREARGWAGQYSVAALERPDDEWKSEGSARVYCRCRGLPLIVREMTPDAGKRDIVARHIDYILQQLGSNRHAIGEADIGNPGNSYPANAFHTYWTLEILENFCERWQPSNESYLREKANLMLLWARQQLGVQIALHEAASSELDTDQLAWAIIVHVRFVPSLASNLMERHLLARGLKCLFAQQQESGSWRRHRPLFHYEKAGNAYCYVFETFATLLRCARDVPAAQQELRPYVDGLRKLAEYADLTRVRLRKPSEYGWHSGLRASTFPEGWVTASVFSFAQSFRVLVGIWTREAAAEALRIRNSPAIEPAKALETLSQRGSTWSADQLTVAHRLAIGFINPLLARGERRSDPDREAIEKQAARSAVLFGPPGTGKTTLAETVADALGWGFVQIRVSDFVSNGFENIYNTTDQIFRQLMQLDHCVILFDEIDELVRRREGEPDASERFLTTSMLPKLSELWKQRRVIFFVATNYVDQFDTAITRGERFDSLIFVPPPSFDSKVAKVSALLEERGISVQFDSSIRFHIDSVLEKIKFAAPEGEQARKRSLDGDAICVKFLLIRWDQLPELAFNLSVSVSTGGTIGVAQLRQALERVADPNLAELKPYSDYLRASQMGRMGIPVTWRLAPQDGASVPTGHPGIVSENGGTWIDSFGSEMPVVAGCDVSPDPVNCGVLILRRVS